MSHFLLSLIVLLHVMATPVYLSLAPVLQDPPFLLLIPLLVIVLTSQVLHSWARHTNLPAGPPEEFLSRDYPLIFH